MKDQASDALAPDRHQFFVPKPSPQLAREQEHIKSRRLPIGEIRGIRRLLRTSISEIDAHSKWEKHEQSRDREQRRRLNGILTVSNTRISSR